MKMETETENKEHQRKNSISSASSSRSSSITSDSSDGHFDIRHFPLPKPSILSTSEAQKQRESHQAYSSDSNRIPSSVFSSKPANSTEWSIASNESLFSIHDGLSTKDDHGLAAALRLAETARLEETNPIPPTKKPNESEKETTAEEEPYQVEKPDSEIDDNEQVEEMTELKSDNEEKEEIIEEAKVLVEVESKNPEEKQVVENAKANKPEDSNSIVSHSPSISCRSDTSNNSISSFQFPVLQKEDADIKTPSMEIKGNIRLQYQQPQSPMLPSKPQPQPYSESSTVTQLQPQSQPERKASKQFESQPQSPKAVKSGWLSCFHCPSKCGLFK